MLGRGIGLLRQALSGTEKAWGEGKQTGFVFEFVFVFEFQAM